MDVIEHLAKAAGVELVHTGKALLVPGRDAHRIVAAAEVRRTPILGIDGFRRPAGGTLVPVMDLIADFSRADLSTAQAIDRNLSDARSFIDQCALDGIFFEFVFGDAKSRNGQQPDRLKSRLDEAIAADEWRGARLAARAKLIAALVLGAMALVTLGPNYGLWFVLWLAGFAAIAVLQLRLRTPGSVTGSVRLLLPLVELVCILAAFLLPHPLDPPDFPPSLRLTFDPALFLGVFIALNSLGQSAREVLLTGLMTVALWVAGTLYVGSQPGVVLTFLDADMLLNGTGVERAAYLTDPWRVQGEAIIRQSVALLLLTVMLALMVRRLRRLVVSQARSERARANLARHFAPTMVDTIADMDQPLGAPQDVVVTVLFADLVGFTRLVDGQPAAAVIALLRDVHGRLAGAVFDHGGTLDKFMGDGLMATFGTPSPAPDDAARALLCALDMQRRITDLNTMRQAAGQPALVLAIGLHHGAVTMGDIGDAQRLEFAVIGPTVNIAARLEEAARPLQAAIVASAATIAAAGSVPTGFVAGPDQVLRGVGAPLPVYCMARSTRI